MQVIEEHDYRDPDAYVKVKKQLAQRFSQAATDYHQKAEVQQRIANCLLDQISPLLHIQQNQTWLDLGCGSGYLIEQIPSQGVMLGIDIAHGMLIEASRKTQGQFINGDAESMPLRTGSVDHLVSSMALQWVSSPKAVMLEIARVLRVGGDASIAILRNDSLQELHQGWQYLGQGSRVNQFASRTQWHNAIEQSGLTVNGVEKRCFHTQHQNLFELLYSIKGIGAGTTIKTSAEPLTRSNLKALEHWWRVNHQINHSLRLTYAVDFWQLSR